MKLQNVLICVWSGASSEVVPARAVFIMSPAVALVLVNTCLPDHITVSATLYDIECKSCRLCHLDISTRNLESERGLLACVRMTGSRWMIGNRYANVGLERFTCISTTAAAAARAAAASRMIWD